MYSIELQTVFYEYQNKNNKTNTSFVSREGPKARADLKIFNFDIRGKLSIIRCDKYILIIPNLNFKLFFPIIHRILIKRNIPSTRRRVFVL